MSEGDTIFALQVFNVGTFYFQVYSPSPEGQYLWEAYRILSFSNEMFII